MTKSLFYLFGCDMPDLLEALVAQMVESPCSAGNPGLSLCWEDPLEKEMATHSSILAWKIP